MIGMVEIEEARGAADERDGADASPQDFHDRVLAQGSCRSPRSGAIFGTAGEPDRSARAARGEQQVVEDPRSHRSSTCPSMTRAPSARSARAAARHRGGRGRTGARDRSRGRRPSSDSTSTKPGGRGRRGDLRPATRPAPRPETPDAELRDAAASASRGPRRPAERSAMSLIVRTPPGRSTRYASSKNRRREEKWKAASTLIDRRRTSHRRTGIRHGVAAHGDARPRPGQAPRRPPGAGTRSR